MSIQQNFPAISPSLNLNFARSKTLDPRITFSRTTTATRVNEQGLVEVVSADIPRFDHEYDASTGAIKSLGLLVEESRSNLVPYSLVFNNQTYWAKFNTFTITPNYDTAPDGTTTASRIVTNGTTINNRIEQTISTGITTNTTYDFSLYIKKNGTASSGRIRLDIINSSGDVLDATNFSVSDNWKKVDVSGSSGTGSSIKIRIRESNDSSAAIDALIWGAQLEAGAFPTSYIPTSGGTATRNPDNVSMEGDNFSDVYNQEEGSYKVEGVINGSLPANTYGGIFGAGGGSSTSNLIFYNPGTSFGQYVSNTGQSPASTLGKTYTVGSKFKISASYATNDFACSLNGDISTSTTSNALYKSHTYFRIGSNPITFAVRGAMTISNISYYSKQITDTQLQNLTK